jgi:hypothetical protein
MAAKKRSSGREGRTPRRKRTIIGMGQFDSGVPDLATNKKHMEDFGLSRSEILQRDRR